MKDVVVVGGGIAGLTAAWELRDLDTVVLEAEERVGGRIKSFQRGPHWVSVGAHMFPGEGSFLWRRLGELGLEPTFMAQSPHLSGVHAAVRNGLGYALLAAGGDGLRPVRHGPLAVTIDARLWLLVGREHRALAAPLRAALWHAMTRQALPEAAA